jgi:hypothetical protein
MLLYAECLAADGDMTGAMGYVNQLRERAAKPVNIVYQAEGTAAALYKVGQYPSTHAAFSDKDVCVKAIRMERKLELAMEGQRWFDLARYGGTYMTAEIDAYLKYESQFIGKFMNVAPLSSEKTTLPIPLVQITTMGKDDSGNDYLQQHGPWK